MRYEAIKTYEYAKSKSDSFFLNISTNDLKTV